MILITPFLLMRIRTSINVSSRPGAVDR